MHSSDRKSANKQPKNTSNLIKIIPTYQINSSFATKKTKLSSNITNSNRYSSSKIKTQPTMDTMNPYLSTNKLIKSIRNVQVAGLPSMTDDFSHRKIAYKQNFIMKKHRLLNLQVGMTKKFCYITIYDTKQDQNYKIRLLQQTGTKVLNKIKYADKKFRDYIFKDENKRYYLSVPLESFSRKFYFVPIEKIPVDEQQQQNDKFLKRCISKLDRTEFIYGKI